MKSEGSLITEKLKSQTPLILARLVFFGDQTPLTLFRVASKTSFYPPKLHFIDLPSMRQMKAEAEIRLLHEFQANVSNRFFQNQDSSFYPPKRRRSDLDYKSKCF